MLCHFCNQEMRVGSLLCEWCGRRQQDASAVEGMPGEEPRSAPHVQFVSDAEKVSDTLATEQVRIYLRWQEMWSSLKRDPLLLGAFVLLGIRALGAVFMLAGVRAGVRGGPIGIFLDILSILSFFGLLVRRNWAWWFVMFSTAVRVLFSVVAIFLLLHIHMLSPGWPIELALGCFILVVFWSRRDYFE